MIFDFEHLSANNRYHLMTQTIIPRPIAWILTKNTANAEADEKESYNLAPFSYFAPLGSDPALLVVSIGNKSVNTMKDTKRNLLQSKECVLHIPSVNLAEQVNQSAANFAYGESEISQLDLTLTPYVDHLPRIAEAGVAMHCQLYDVHELSDSQTACYLAIQSLYVNDALVSQDDQRTVIHSQTLNPLSRLGGSDYTELGDLITLKRPS